MLPLPIEEAESDCVSLLNTLASSRARRLTEGEAGGLAAPSLVAGLSNVAARLASRGR